MATSDPLHPSPSKHDCLYYQENTAYKCCLPASNTPAPTYVVHEDKDCNPSDGGWAHLYGNERCAAGHVDAATASECAPPS